jgi:hypothetical protein
VLGGEDVRRTFVLWGASVALALALALTGCASPGPNVVTLTRLHLPHLTYLPAVSAMRDRTGGNRIEAVFLQRGNAEPLVLVAVYPTGLEVIGRDGTGERHITTDGTCWSRVAVSPDGEWAACIISGPPPGSASSETSLLQVVSLSPHDQPLRRTFNLGLASTPVGPAWSPTGRYLAVGGASSGTGCTVMIVAVSLDATQFTPVGSFTSDALDRYPARVCADLAWSPDGTSLRLGTRVQFTYMLDSHIALAQVLAAMAKGSPLTIPATAFVPFSPGVSSFGLVWRPHDNTAVVGVSSAPGEPALQVRYYTSPGHPPDLLLTLPDAAHQLLGAAWTPDGRQLVLVIGTPACLDCGTDVLPDVYLFTPPLSLPS